MFIFLNLNIMSITSYLTFILLSKNISKQTTKQHLKYQAPLWFLKNMVRFRNARFGTRYIWKSWKMKLLLSKREKCKKFKVFEQGFMLWSIALPSLEIYLSVYKGFVSGCLSFIYFKKELLFFLFIK